MKNYKGFRLPPASTCNVEGCNNHTSADDEQELQGKDSIIIASICGTCDQLNGLEKDYRIPHKMRTNTHTQNVSPYRNNVKRRTGREHPPVNPHFTGDRQ